MAASITSGALSGIAQSAERLSQAIDASQPAGRETDEAIMFRVQGGDKDALGSLFDRYSRLILGLGLRILRDASEAQELVQEVFLYVYQKSAAFDASKASLRTWLVQITYSRAFNRRGYLQCRHFYDAHNVDDMTESLASSLSMEDYGESLDLKKFVQAAFADLTERQRMTLQMFFFGGYSIKEISSCLQESIDNTRNHYRRGLGRLRQRMKILTKQTPAMKA